mmetsp:Transcript_18270/g.29723  ORF Transcript_18270/g.29723 Transcript_18270/m.29723 type:complete len:277 (+) Transcript_18270:1329-2159(+)|eukprot:CAMPEP_0203765886 /NCGR_PEP_ID=MMETSP0099_2-20121227/111_1 /ASSEMBLY_ACC=CAM_ASM_000209 /TAXON_ID=96639 /ORGANISM=" , Strain NY0313808BC1" /LENGTH=276 /DNA_ID=CAMNT_0050662175 /DNA_START=123 /DNA_END=953 /DNA_ORIENTATION=-
MNRMLLSHQVLPAVCRTLSRPAVVPRNLLRTARFAGPSPFTRGSIVSRGLCTAKGVPPGKKEDEEVEKKKKQTWGDLMARHGPVFVVYWGSAWALSALGIYAAIEANGPETAIHVADQIGLSNVVDLENINPQYGNLGLALGLNEAFELVRFPFVAATTPKLTAIYEKYFGKVKGRKPGKFSMLMKEHGMFFLVYWTGFWAVTGVACYGAVSWFGPETAINIVKYVGLDNFIDVESLNPSVGNVAVAVLINEALEPIRLPIVVASLTTVKRLLKRS